MPQSLKNILVVMQALLWVSSCASKAEYSSTFRKIITSEHGVFRGVDFDTPISNVKKIETTKPEIDDILGLRYQIQLNENETLFIEYDKQEDKVKSIRAKIQLKNYQNAELLYNELLNYYKQKHGKPRGRERESYWQVKDTKSIYYLDLIWVEKENTLYLDIRK
ncbi:MAG: hypothetical protein NZ455_08080 [Bacteroidia bacterium]|nr:hypothetical protein [Bacteroidia bacterium]MDW8346669.1 hypothetical protein [Bacteroidia bacterium]